VIASPRERLIAPRVSAALALMTASIHSTTSGRGDPVRDETPEQHHLPAEVNTEPPCGNRTQPTETRLAFARIDWAALLKRIYDVDALACPCGGRLRFISLIIEPEVAQAILRCLGLPSAPPPIARARSPDPRDPFPLEE
jgi:hypothetical protein